MLQSGIPRATTGAILGFFFGAAIVTMIRAISGFEPAWNLGLAMTLGVFMAAAGVVWGMGGFNPELSEHPDDSKPTPTTDELAEKYGPLSTLGDVAWTVTFSSLLIMVISIALAYLPGFGLTVTNDQTASVKGIGMVDMDLFGVTGQVSQLTLLIGWLAFIVLSLVIVAALGALFWFALNQQVESAKAAERTGSGLPRPLERALANQAGRAVARMEAKIADKETTSVVSKDN